MSKNEKQKKLKVLRVTQFDAEQIDDSIFNTLKNFLIDSLKGDNLSWILNFEPELSTCLHILLWYLSVHKLGKTIGQSMLGTEYNKQHGSTIDNNQKKTFLVYIFIKWLRNRETVVLKIVEKYLKPLKGNHSVQLSKIFKYAELLTNIMVYVNMLQFLRTGDHISIMERCLQLCHVYTGKPYPRYIDYSYIRKEMMWEAITQTVLCVLPLINFKQLFIYFNNLWWRPKKNKSRDSIMEMKCQICELVPTNPYQNGCYHLFCYYCMMVNTVDGFFTCQVCGHASAELGPANFVPSTIHNNTLEFDS